jgi:hypothetical protein
VFEVRAVMSIGKATKKLFCVSQKAHGHKVREVKQDAREGQMRCEGQNK